MLDKSPTKPAVNVPNDLAAHWMPFTANRAFKAAPKMFVSADGMGGPFHGGQATTIRGDGSQLIG